MPSEIEEDRLVVSLKPDDEVPGARLGRRWLRHERLAAPGCNETQDRIADPGGITLEVNARVDLAEQTARQEAHVHMRCLLDSPGANDSRLDRGERTGAVGVGRQPAETVESALSFSGCRLPIAAVGIRL